MWSHRFEAADQRHTWTLEEVRRHLPHTPGIEWRSNASGTVMKVSVSPSAPRVVARLPLSTLGPSEWLHCKVQLCAKDLHPGPKPWEDGRLLLEWLGSNGTTSHDSLGSCRENLRSPSAEVMIRSETGPAMPTLRIEHIGTSGSFEVSELNLTAARESGIWTYGKWLLAGWMIVSLTLVLQSHLPERPGWSNTLAACLWVLMASQFVVPGPWKDAHPLWFPFSLQPDGATFLQHSPETSSNPINPPIPPASMTDLDARNDSLQLTTAPSLPPLGKLPDKGSLILKIKLQFQEVRELLHALLLAGPALLLAMLSGRRASLMLCISLSLLIEVAQFAFGYGSDLTDLADLTCDGLGIAIGLLCHRLIHKRHWYPTFLQS